MARKKSYNLILYELQQEAIRQEALKGHKVTSDVALQKQAEEEYIAPIKNVNPANRTTNNSLKITNKDKKDLKTVNRNTFKKTWLTKGAFEDGYQKGDVIKTLLGTTADVGVGVVKGLGQIGEGLMDLGSYGVAGVSDLLGNEEFADKVKKKAQSNSTDKLFSPIESIIDPYSVIGEKGDSVSQGLGYVAGIMATGGAAGAAGLGTIGTTAVTTGLTGLSAMGSGMSEAYQGGATDEEALKYGIIAGVAEAGSELIFGGLGKAVNAVGLSKGLSSLDDALAKKISSKLTSTLSKNLAEYTVKAGAEGVEEVISGITQGIGKKMTYMSEENLVQILKDENLLEQFIVGTVTSSIAQAPGLVKTTSQGRDFISGYTQDEQAQIDGLQQAIEQETIARDKATDPRAKQISQEKIDGLTQELNELTNAQTITDESELKKQRFTYQAQENDSEYKRRVYESAAKHFDNTETTHKFIDAIANIAEERSTVYEFTTTEEIKQGNHNVGDNIIDGFVQDGKVQINVDSPKFLNVILGHETTHLLEGKDENTGEYSKEYKALKQIAIDFAKSKGDYDARIERLTKLYEGTDADIEAELTSDIVGEYLFTDYNFVKELSVKQPTVFEKIKNFISDLVVKFKGTDQEKQLRQLQRSFEKAYKAQGQQTTDTKYSLSDTLLYDYSQGEKGNALIYSDSQMKEIIDSGEIEDIDNVKQFARTISHKEKGSVWGERFRDSVIEKYSPKEKRHLIKQYIEAYKEQYNNTNPTTNPDIRYSLSEEIDIDTKINSSMTMAEAKSMVERAFFANNIKDWYDGQYKTGVEWLKDVGVEEVGMYIENTYETQSKYINSNPDILNEEYTIEDVLQAYLDGTLKGKTQETLKRLDLSKDTGYKDDRFYAPKEYSNDIKLYEIANQRVTKANRSEVYKARADFIINAHNKGYAESIGLTQQEVNKKLKSWANYPKRAMDLSNSINEGVATQNRWAGIENSSIVNTISVSNEQMESLVKEVKGDSNGWQRKYITSTMLALDTHINYKNLTIEFDQGVALREKHAAGDYNSETDTIRIGDAYQNTVAHEMGHYIDKLWAKELNLGSRLTDKHYLYDTAQARLTEEQKTFTKNFDKFLNSIENSSDIRSKYTMSSNEVFARFVGRFTEWVKNQATSNRYGYEEKWYKDNFTESQYIEFARLLQEKSVLDAMDKQFKDDLRATIDAVKGKHSLSDPNEKIAPTGNWNVRGEDIKLQVEEAIAPLQETISNLTEQVKTLQENIPIAEQNTEAIPEVKPTQPTLEEVQNLMDIKENQSGSEYARAFYALRDKYGQVELYKSLNEYYSTGTVTQPSNVENIDTAPVSQEVVEQQGQEALDNITDNDAPVIDVNNMSFEDAVDAMMMDYVPTTDGGTEVEVKSPLDNRDIDEVGRDRKIKAYQYENPEVKPYFQEEAQNMLYDLDNTIKGERGAAIDELGNMEYYGITRQTTEAIAYLKDNYGYSYDQIRQGLNKIIEDDGKENNAVSKRIEFMLDERLREGYTTSDGIPIPANEDYINFLNEKQITEYNKEAFNTLTDEDMPIYEKIEPRESATARENTQVKQTIPIRVKTAQNGNTDVTKAKERSWAKTSTESDIFKGKILISDLDAEKIQYIPITNKETLAKANATLDNLGYEEALDQFYSKIKSGEIPKLVDITMGQRLMQEALAKGDKETAIEILQDITMLGTEVGQITQSLSIIQRMTPAGQLRMLDKVVQRGKLRGEESFKGLELTEDMKNRIMDCYNEDGQTYDQDKLNEVMEQIKQELAAQMPVTKMDKINEWRYFSMLGNPKTHARNIISTAANYATIEVKNVVARTMEEVAPVLGIDIDRTKTWKQSSQEVKDFAEKTTLEMKDIILGENQLGIKSELKAKRKIFKTEFWNKLFGGNSDLMTKEDSWFSKPTFKRSLQEFLTANGIQTQQDIEANPKLVEKGKQYALEQSQIATFRQRSWLASKISEIERKNTFTQIAVGSVLPFKKTPINIAKAGLSYSPIGALKSLTYDVYQVKKGNMEASTLIDHIAQGATGTALTLIGYMLTQAGFLNGAGDDDKEGKYDYYLGKQGYSINIGDSTYSLSWLSPLAMPLLVGANAYEKLIEKDEWNADVVLETLSQTLDPLSEMSFLSSLDDVMSSYDSGIMKWASIGQTAIQNYITQFVPTLSSQIAATMDDTKRTTKVSGDSTFKVGEELYNQLIYKIPVLRETLEPTLDIWGNEVKQSENLFTRAFENFISPYARKDSIATEIDEELKDLYSQTGDNGILPNIPYNYVNYDGEKYNMSAEEYTDYKKTYGQTANDLLEDLFRTTTYKNATSEERTDMVNDVYDYARDEAKLEYLAKEGVDYTNATEDKEEVYKENLIKGAIENDMTTEEYGLYVEDPEEYKFLMEKDYEYRRKYFDVSDSLKEIEESFTDQKEGTNDDDELDAIYTEKKTSIIDKIINSGLEDTEKASLYKKYYNSDTVDTIMKSAINIDDYLVYETKEFKADKNEKGNSIPGSRKEKVEDYVFSIDGLNTAQKAIIIKATNTFKYNDYNEQIVRYVDNLGLTYEEVKNILEDLDMTVDDEGNVYWK